MVRKRIPIRPAFTPNTPKSSSGSNLKAGTPTTPVSNKKTISSSHYKTIFLHDWWLVKPQGKGLAVGGVASMEKLGERVIFSTLIAKRHATNVLETQDGITFIITGFINKSRTHENGFSFEICRRFLFGFPHDWEEYIQCVFGKEHNSGNTGLVDSNTCPLKITGDAVPSIVDDNICASEFNDLSTSKGDLICWLLNKSLCDSIGKMPENVSEQSDPANNIECNITMNTKECDVKGDTNLETSRMQHDQMHNIENGISDVILETRDENPTVGFDSGMKLNSPEPSGGPSGKGTNRSPSFPKEKKKKKKKKKYYHRFIVKKQKMSEDADFIVKNQKLSEDADCRRVTRSISKMRQTTMPLRKEKENTFVSSPVRRSPRLCTSKCQAHKMTV